MKYSALQNGSDIRGIGSEGVASQPVNLTDKTVQDLAGAFGLWLSKVLQKPCETLKVSIGRDSRISGPRILNAAIAGLTSLGISVFDTGLASTPAMFMSTITKGFDYDGAIMITASHLPFNRNGLKFFTKDGGLEKENISEIIAIAEDCNLSSESMGTVSQIDFMSSYASALVEKIRNATGASAPLDGFKIIVDAGNGAGGFFVEKVLAPLGADTQGSQFLEPDGTFPNHIPNPEDQGANDAIISALHASKADLGIIFDTDVDRAGVVDSQGHVINKNRLIALMSAILLEEHPGTTIVTDSTTSSGLKTFIESRGGIHHRFKRGYKNVINESKRLCAAGQDSQLAIETSGHGALKENYFLDDGAYLVVKILIKMAQLKQEGKTLFSLIEDLKEPAEAVEYRLNIAGDGFKEYGQTIIEELTEYVSSDSRFHVLPDNYEGIRVSLMDGWFLLRLSLHDPLMPLNIESNQPGEVAKISAILGDFLSKYDRLDISSLTK